LATLNARRFNPWEGGEGLASAQFVCAHRALGLAALEKNDAAGALEHFEAARVYPHNLGEGKHLLTLERDLDYFSALAAESLGDAGKAREYWTAAAAPLAEPSLYTYFRALALRALGEEEASRAALEELARFAETKAQATPKIDYFATSLPNLLLFDDDLKKRSRIESLGLAGLACHGLGANDRAADLLRQATSEDPNHLVAVDALRWIQRHMDKEAAVRPAS
jgi:tetratricopeptide (TPR) repeat protein